MGQLRRITGVFLLVGACAVMAGCVSTAAVDVDDDVVTQPSATVTASVSPPSSVTQTLMVTLVQACPTLTSAQSAQLESALQDLIAVEDADQVRADPQLVERNVELFLDNFEQMCAMPFSSNEQRNLARELTRAIGS